MNRAFAVLELRGVGEGNKRTFSGIATTPSTDRMGDVVEPKGAKFKLPMPLLWQHDARQPIGWVTKATVTPQGIRIEGEVADVPEPGLLKDRLAEAWQSIKATLVRGLSIGFTPLDSEPVDAKEPWGAQRFKSWEWLELSAVTIPANQDASIGTIKSIDANLRAASGRTHGVNFPALGNKSFSIPKGNGNAMNAYTPDALLALRDERATHEKRMEELLTQKTADGFSTEQRDEFDTSRAAISDLDDQIAVAEVHVSNIRTARPVEGRVAPFGFAKKLTDVEPLFKGELGVKKFVAETIATIDAKKGLYRNAWQVADQLWGKTNPTLVQIMKANVAGGGSGTGEWGAELVQADTRYTGDFIEYLNAVTVFDKLQLREVPHNVVIKGQDGKFTGYWVGESKPIPMSKGDFSSTTTSPLKVAGLTVLSNELIRDSSPAALTMVGEGLREALAQIVDTTFFSANAAVAGVSPAGITNGVAALTSSGGSAMEIIHDIQTLFAPFVTALNARGGRFEFVMTTTLAIAVSMLRNALGQQDAFFAGVTPNGGTIGGYPVHVGDNIGVGDVYLLRTSDIWKIGDLGVSLSVSNEAMIEQSDAPTGATDTPVAASAMFTSMFQEESTAIKVVRPINWGKRRTPAVSWIGDATWGSETS